MRIEIGKCRLGCWGGMAFALAFVCQSHLLAEDDATPNPIQTAKAVDEAIEAELALSKTPLSETVSDEDFLRRVTFDLAGTLPAPEEVTLFGLDPDPAKREKRIARLLESDDYATNWTRYWRDVIFSRSTNMRAPFARSAFETWMTEELKANTPWDQVATAVMTAKGDVRENGETALIFVQDGDPSEVASEVSRIFLGIQIQCANCHNHPSDKWTREDFHELAAFFPRIRVQPIREGDRQVSYEIVSVNPRSRRGFGGEPPNPEQLMRFLDRNRDGKLTKDEVENSPLGRAFDQILAQVDADKDKAISLEEYKQIPPPPAMPGRGSDEHYMPDLDDPSSRGKQIDPVFFLTEQYLTKGQSDEKRRQSIAEWITSPDNPWFARAYVNRIWGELLGQGFYSPIDDIGPEREARFPKVLDILSEGFIGSGYDVKWLFRTIANTQAYQRQVKPADPQAPSFACAVPTRLRSDQLYSAINQVFGLLEQPASGQPGRGGNPYFRGRSPRDGFNDLFGFDPSTPQEEVTGDVPQALFLMNSPQINSLIQATGRTRLGQVLSKYPDDEDAISELYLLALAREPSEKELAICQKYIAEVKSRSEAFEDLLWSLLNSSEFLSKR